jgi:hypothetical protein
VVDTINPTVIFDAFILVIDAWDPVKFKVFMFVDCNCPIEAVDVRKLIIFAVVEYNVLSVELDADKSTIDALLEYNKPAVTPEARTLIKLPVIVSNCPIVAFDDLISITLMVVE